jgi:hypothetical protein
MSDIPLAALQAVATRLDGLGLDYAFLGGAVVGLLLDKPEFTPVRPTDDVDVVVEAVSRARYADVEAKLRALKFDHDMRPGAPRCRWVLGNLTVDIMPVEGSFLGLNTAWFRGFVATKYVAFLDRGAGDHYSSHDLEDLIAVIDGRAKFAEEVSAADPALRAYVRKAIAALLASSDFLEALPGHVRPDAASQSRLPGLIRKLESVAAGAPS